MKDLTYKGFIGSVEYDEESNTLYGTVKFIQGLISYESEDGTIPSLQQAFKESVDEYLADCEEMGLKAQSSANGIVQVRLGPELHYKANVKANEESLKLNQLIRNAVQDYVDHKGIHLHKTVHNNHNYAATLKDQVQNTEYQEIATSAIFSAREKASCH